MKARLYKKHVLEGEKDWSSVRADRIKEHKKHIVLFVFSVILACLIPAFSTIILVRHTSFAPVSVFFVPIVIRLLLPFIKLLAAEHKDIKLLKLNRDIYPEWMSLQDGKISGSDMESACRIAAEYRNTYCERHDELLKLLREYLAQKPANQLLVSVVAGLVFLGNETSDYKQLFDAKYRHGAAGNMIPGVWIKVLDPKQKEGVRSHVECAKEFLAYWDQKIIVQNDIQ